MIADEEAMKSLARMAKQGTTTVPSLYDQPVAKRIHCSTQYKLHAGLSNSRERSSLTGWTDKRRCRQKGHSAKM